MDTKVYPNPTNGNLTIEFNSYAGGKYDFTITDLSGRTIISADIQANAGLNQHNVDLGSVTPGTYMLYLKNETGKISVNKITLE